LHQLIEDYNKWLRDRTALKQLDEGWVEITTPYLDRHNDYLQVYARRDGDKIVLTDDGYIISDLRLSGCELDTYKRQEILSSALNGFGVDQDGDALIVRASADTFPLRKHSLVQAMLAVNDMFYLSAPSIRSLFLEDVGNWLDEEEIRYVEKSGLAGRSGITHVFDFVIPKSKAQPMRLIKTINRPDRSKAEAAVFAWIDTMEVRAPGTKGYAMLNDSDEAPPQAALEVLSEYELRPVLWSQRSQLREELAA
jgi:hypothetical protein